MAARRGGGGEPQLDWRTYAEARADFDRAVEGIETRMREMEARIMKRLDDQDGSLRREHGLQREGNSDVERRLRDVEQALATLKSQKLDERSADHSREITVLKTTNKLLAGALTLATTLLGLAIAFFR